MTLSQWFLVCVVVFVLSITVIESKHNIKYARTVAYSTFLLSLCGMAALIVAMLWIIAGRLP